MTMRSKVNRISDEITSDVIDYTSTTTHTGRTINLRTCTTNEHKLFLIVVNYGID